MVEVPKLLRICDAVHQSQPIKRFYEFMRTEMSRLIKNVVSNVSTYLNMMKRQLCVNCAIQVQTNPTGEYECTGREEKRLFLRYHARSYFFHRL